AIVDAQGIVEQRFIEQVSKYFDSTGRPACLAVKIPKPSATSPDDYAQVGVPLLSLVESQMLAIRDMKVEMDVELGSVLDNPAAAPAMAMAMPPPPAPAMALATPPAAFRTAGAPIDYPTPGGARPAPPPPQPQAAMAMAAPAQPGTMPPPPDKMLTLGVGSGGTTGPRARLTINVAANQPSEGMLRLLTQLNKLV
ncbi:MAG: DUF2589 domain-containing protein, partial [Proteobacteria bacterium]|nr:DUF2589 domain-containing protein [Pseudomonadota bacterium]